jgi:RimJ/RimL family protein N-acetyltransferase
MELRPHEITGFDDADVSYASSPFTIRRATLDDALTLLAWKNDPHALAMSRNTAPVGEAEHIAWLGLALSNPDREILIAHDAGRPVGTVRLDRGLCGDAWEVSINVAPDERRKGYGRRMLELAMVPGRRYVAEIKPENAASLRLFSRIGFKYVMAHEGFVTMERK